eukprot:GFUD01118013.1.p2 GENE.GFUD01118013.1~~GFUD01118013.1.p2  ORF type:complete len:148 (-),score=27.27 GFUD01118013.1:102-545(-)
MLLPRRRKFGERGKPRKGKPSENCLHRFPLGFLDPTSLFFFECLYSSFIIPNSRNLGSKHNRSKKREQKTLEKQKENEDDCGRWGVHGAGSPVSMDAAYEMVDAEKETVVGYQSNVKGKKNKKLLVLLPHTVVNPGAVMVHLLDTSA